MLTASSADILRKWLWWQAVVVAPEHAVLSVASCPVTGLPFDQERQFYRVPSASGQWLQVCEVRAPRCRSDGRGVASLSHSAPALSARGRAVGADGEPVHVCRGAQVFGVPRGLPKELVPRATAVRPGTRLGRRTRLCCCLPIRRSAEYVGLGSPELTRTPRPPVAASRPRSRPCGSSRRTPTSACWPI